MNVYIESNFVLELALLQEQHTACEEILRLSERGALALYLPAYALMESVETLTRRQADRRQVRTVLENQLVQLARTAIYTERLPELKGLASLLVDSAVEDLKRLEHLRSRFLNGAGLIALEGSILSAASQYQSRYDLHIQDAVMYASILSHLELSRAPGCFLTRDGDFDDPRIKRELKSYNCKLVWGFESGLQFLSSYVAKGAPE